MKKRKKIYKTVNTKHFNTTIESSLNANNLKLQMDILDRNTKLKELLEII
jgi:hypothetical protein